MEEKKMTPQERYKKKYAKRIAVDLTTNTDMDIIEKLDSIPNKTGYIKSLIRADIAKQGVSQMEQQS